MKKTIIYLIATLSLTLGLMSCSNGKNDPDVFSLEGTKWEYIEKLEGKFEITTTLNFTDASKGVTIDKFVDFVDPQKNEMESDNFSYIYKKPILSLTFTSGELKGEIITLTVDETAKTITVTDKEHPENNAVFKKK